jgi:TonB family protein
MEKITLIFLSLLVSIVAAAQSSCDIVTLVVTGEGATKEAAIQEAKLSSVRQAYAKLVSADASKLTDEIVMDSEIMNARPIVIMDMPNGGKEITLLTSINIPNLINYARSKGFPTEIAAAVLTKRMRKFELQKDNELFALNTLKGQIQQIIPLCLNSKITLEGPVLPPHNYENHVFGNNYSYGLEQFYNARLNDDMIKPIEQKIIKWGDSKDDYWVTLHVDFTQTKYFNILKEIIKRTFMGLNLTDDEIRSCEELNQPFTERYYSFVGIDTLGKEQNEETNHYTFRNSEKKLVEWEKEVEKILNGEVFNFSITDNTGTISDIYEMEYFPIPYEDTNHKKFKHLVCDLVPDISNGYEMKLLEGTGLFSPYVMLGYAGEFTEIWQNSPAIILTFPISKQNIDKYSDFSILRKTKKPTEMNIDLGTTDKKQTEEERIYKVVEQMPSFPGGQSALNNWLSNHVIYPVEAQKNGIQGRVVVEMIINKNGTITNPTIARSADPLLDQETLRVVGEMPKWNPGKQNGEVVRCYYAMPISFSLK